MLSEQLKEEIRGLELSEKLLLVEEIWDSIAAENKELPFPEWQKIELEKRYREYQEGSLELIDWEDVHQALRDKHK